MTTSGRKIPVHLDRIEAELRRLGWWQEDEVDPFAHLGPEEPRSYLTASSFEQWLQFVFLPNARAAWRAGTLPTSSQVGLMAKRQYDYHSIVSEARDLLQLLFEFDELVRAFHAGQA